MKKGVTLVEVLIFVTILSIFFISAASVMTAALRNMKVNEHKIIATHYAKQLEEWLRSQREDDWEAFNQKDNISAGYTQYCFNDISLSWPVVAGACPVNPTSLNPPIFNRDVKLTSNDCGGGYVCSVNVDITVSWSDLGQNYSVPVRSMFEIFEQ